MPARNPNPPIFFLPGLIGTLVSGVPGLSNLALRTPLLLHLDTSDHPWIYLTSFKEVSRQVMCQVMKAIIATSDPRPWIWRTADGICRRRAGAQSPRLVKRGRYFQGRKVNVSRLLGGEAAPERVLGSEQKTPTLQQHLCHRCGKAWWPRRPSKPARCPGCKSPYWDRPRQPRGAMATPKGGVNDQTLTHTLRQAATKALHDRNGLRNDDDDRSLSKALAVLKEMKAAGRTWQEMGARMEQEFGSRLDKDQLKALVR